MSRIQKAIAKAAQQRKNQTSEPVQLRDSIPSDTPVEDDYPVPVADTPKPVFPAGEDRSFENPILVAANEAHPVVKEQFRKLKSEILVKTQSGKNGNSLLVTSSIAGEGKTFTACNLALSLAHDYDHTVLLIDADLRKPRVHEFFGMEASNGLIQCLQGESRLEDALQHAGYGKLTILPAGGTVSEPAELLSSQKMRQFLMEIKRRYEDRFVIIDCSPALLFSDTKALASVVDGVIYVVRERVAQSNHVQEGLNNLKEASILGVVYNGTDEKTVANDYHSYY